MYGLSRVRHCNVGLTCYRYLQLGDVREFACLERTSPGFVRVKAKFPQGGRIQQVHVEVLRDGVHDIGLASLGDDSQSLDFTIQLREEYLGGTVRLTPSPNSGEVNPPEELSFLAQKWSILSRPIPADVLATLPELNPSKDPDAKVVRDATKAQFQSQGAPTKIKHKVKRQHRKRGVEKSLRRSSLR